MTKTFLDTDFTKVSGQNYALISIVEPNEKLNSLKENQCALKIKGCFDTIDNAKAWAKKLQEEDNSFNIYVVDMYSWLLIPPDQEKIEDVQYRDEMLNKIIGGRKEEERKANAMFQQYKNEMQEAGKDEMFSKESPGTSSSTQSKTPDPTPEEPDSTAEEPKTLDPTAELLEIPEDTQEESIKGKKWADLV